MTKILCTVVCKIKSWSNKNTRFTRFLKFGISLFLLVFFIRVIVPHPLSQTSFSTRVFDKKDKLLRMTLSGDEKYRLYLSPKNIPTEFLNLLFEQEDKYFYWHLGFNPWSLLKAVKTTYLVGSRKVGASTITMQLVRLLSPIRTKNVQGKLKQIAWSLYYELIYSKNEILEAYLNRTPFGGNVEGFAAASFLYFGKDIQALNGNEFKKLLLLPRNPQLTSKPEFAEKVGLPTLKSRIALVPFEAPHFVDHLLRANKLGRDIRSTLDLDLQHELETKLETYVKTNSEKGIKNAMALVVDTKTMQIQSWIGSANYLDNKIQGQFNGVLGLRSPGSALKPFIYALALDQGLIHPQTLLKDTPLSMGLFDPENFDRKFSGPLSAEEALNQSRNVPAVYLTSLLSEPSFYSFLKDIANDGFLEKFKDEKHYGHALSLGGVELSMYQLLTLYSMIANNGELKNLKSIRSDKNKFSKKVLSAESTFLVRDMLSRNKRSDSNLQDKWLTRAIPVSWKTGTSQGFKDAWTVGLFDRYALAVWIGNFDGEANPYFIGREMAAPLFFSMVDSLKSRVHKAYNFYASKSIKEIEVCSLSGALPGADCPHRKKTLFIAGKSPINKCTIHRSFYISKKTKLRSCLEPTALSSKDYEKKVFEVWPSDLLKVFRMGGIERNSLPKNDSSCDKSGSFLQSGLAPQIQSPRHGVEYSFERSGAEAESIPFSAVADGDAKTLSWFIDREFIGTTDTDKVLFWKPKLGQHIVRVIDDWGRSDERLLKVKIF